MEDRKDDWLAARLEDPGYGYIDGICNAARAYPLEGIKKDKLDTALGYFENKPPACAASSSASAACPSDPASSKQDAKWLSASASSSPACTGPPTAQTSSSRSAASRPADPQTASETHRTTRQQPPNQRDLINDLGHLQK
jgi:hypothetical protein